MIKLEIWNKTTGFNLADGTPQTVEHIYEKYPFTRNSTIVLEYLPNGNVGAIDDLAILKQVYDLAPELTPEEALVEIIKIKETPPAPYADPVEAKLDYLVMVSS